ncbi:hypothetical protein [Azospirillum sp. TSO22-1]|uniref:hypothetical protein n=1 Tax=Azospirillum sp. TSO22-1 TaxID=716789 RepID=UPI000D60C6D8|nr:hypothetical protein [Azospirillum sp. TSO22-1]PWC54643.1 hypothetical protein TSO221_08390 [Azospirillum sp. TSO22-1]
MNRAAPENWAEHWFGTEVPRRFLEDTPEAERPQVTAMLESSATFLRNCARYRVVAEVVEAQRCMAGVKVGDRYVFQGAALDPGRTTGPLCAFLIAMLVQRVGVAFDRFGRDEAPSPALTGAHCTDPGPAVGGFGQVRARLWIEPAGAPP